MTVSSRMIPRKESDGVALQSLLAQPAEIPGDR